MKVILNHDVPNLGELGDVKDVAAGYARNFLLPRGLVYPYSPATVGMFAKRKAEIEVRKAEKRASSMDLKTRLEAEELVLDMPAGQNGKLFGAVSNASIADELLKSGISIDRKKIDVPGRVIKSVGNYKISIRLYEKEEATVKIVVKGHVERAKNVPAAPDHQRKRRHEEHPVATATEAKVEASPQIETESSAETQN
ncbi:MAG: 50S ribosomal protein L9 [Spirochaetes bacterium RIFOXYC1_FULL_54_7]|nr:MAG: 50S ribosomal protein L9 [Spirochaetes bacterium RIFOXYC1_FULL_54_7]